MPSIALPVSLRGQLLSGSRFSPLSLFTASEPGLWYDPSDLTTLFQDTAGTSPVTTPGQTVARINDKSGRGNNATQATAASRPTYGIVPLGGRRNLLGNMTQADTGWVTAGTTPPTLAMSQTYLGESCTSVTFTSAMTATYAGTRALQSGTAGALGASVVIGNTYCTSYHLSLSRALVGGEQIALYFTGTTGLTEMLLTEANTSSLVGVFERRSNTANPSGGASGTVYPYVYLKGAMSSNVTLYINKIQIELGSTATAYQRVGTAFDVTEAGVRSLSYLSFDGVDDFLVTPTITPGVDKLQVFAGLRKLSDAVGYGILAETGGGSGTFTIHVPYDQNTGSLDFTSRGTSGASATVTTGYAAPLTTVMSGLGDISGDRATLRLNGTQVSQNTGDQGTGNYLANAVFIGRRAGTSLPFNGNIYQLIVRFGANLDAGTLSSAETFVNGKTGAY